MKGVDVSTNGEALDNNTGNERKVNYTIYFEKELSHKK